MTKDRKRWYQDVPWGWVATTAYGTALGFALSAQVAGLGRVEDFLYRYQTLLAGAATFGAILLAIQQLRHERRRDEFAAVWRYEEELWLLGAIRLQVQSDEWDTEPEEDIPDIGRSLQHRIEVSTQRWARFRAQSHITLDHAIEAYLNAVALRNEIIEAIDQGTSLELTPQENERLRLAHGIYTHCRDYLREIMDTRWDAIGKMMDMPKA